MIRKHYDKIFLGLALTVLLIAFAFSAFSPEAKPITEFVDIPRLEPKNTFTPSPPPQVEVAVAEWQDPQPQSAGPEWVFDVFTPPVIFYNPITETFELPYTKGPTRDPDFGVSLVDVREELYRIQVAGYGGNLTSGYFVILQNVETGASVLARDEKEYPDLEAELRSFRLERIPVSHGGSTNVTAEVAFVVIYDMRLEKEIELRSGLQLKEDKPTAVFMPTGEDTEIRVKQGESFNHGDFTYLVEKIEAPTAVVVRISQDDSTERESKTLAVLSPEARKKVQEGNEAESTNSEQTTGGRSNQSQSQPQAPTTKSQDDSGVQFAF